MPVSANIFQYHSRIWIPLLTLAVPIIMILCARFASRNFLGTLSLHHYGLLSGCSLLLAAVLYLLKFVADRRAVYRTFTRGNVPTLECPKLFSGNLWATYFQPNNASIIRDLHKKLGPTYGLYFGPDPWVETTDLELLKRVFVTEGSIHVDKSQLNVPFVKDINESIVQARGDRWRHIRRVIAPSFHQKQMKTDNVFSDFDAVGELLCEFIETCRLDDSQRVAQDGRQSASTVRMDVLHTLEMYSLEVMMRVAFGRVEQRKWSKFEQDQLIGLTEGAQKLFITFFARLSMMLPFLQRPLGHFVPFTKVGALLSHIHTILDESLRVRRQQQVRPRDRKMIDSLIESSRAGRMDDDTLKANLFFLMMAGYETTSFLMTFLLLTLAWHQDKQDKLRDEPRAHGQQADYLDWCIQEALRLYPPAPLANGRRLVHDIEHKGMRFFKGTTINASIWAIHLAKEYWGDDVDQFRPERMGEPVDDPENMGISKLRQFAFTHGPRHCPGQNFALAEAHSLITKLIVRYRVLPCVDTPRQLDCSSPNFYHWIIHHPIELEFEAL